MTERIALVTGANQGLGLALVEGLARTMEPDDVVYLAARTPEKGEQAARGLTGTRARVQVERLDVTDDDSVASLAATLQDRHGGVDIVISNAAARMSRDVPHSEQVRTFIATNNHGTYRMLKHFTPRLRDHARFIIVASSFGSLTRLSPALHHHFDVDSASLEDIEALMDRYVELVEGGTAEDEGWPEWINIPSKVAQVASARIAARMMQASRPDAGILINGACPGLVDTAASRPWFDDMSGAQTPEEAAKAVVWLATLPPGTDGPNGELVRFKSVFPWK